jgi:hypothetical protein
MTPDAQFIAEIAEIQNRLEGLMVENDMHPAAACLANAYNNLGEAIDEIRMNPNFAPSADGSEHC